jgi:hypothetical protein
MGYEPEEECKKGAEKVAKMAGILAAINCKLLAISNLRKEEAVDGGIVRF